jgi:hypothetical protein
MFDNLLNLFGFVAAAVAAAAADAVAVVVGFFYII